MNRKEFIHQLFQLSDPSGDIKMTKEAPLFCCRQSKLVQKPVPKEGGPARKLKSEKAETGKGEVLILVNQKQRRRGGSAFKMRSETNRREIINKIITIPCGRVGGGGTI